MSSRKKETYQYVIARVEEEDGRLIWEYRVFGSEVSFLRHDEDVSGWTDREVIKLTKAMLNIDADDPVKIRVERC